MTAIPCRRSGLRQASAECFHWQLMAGEVGDVVAVALVRSCSNLMNQGCPPEKAADDQHEEDRQQAAFSENELLPPGAIEGRLAGIFPFHSPRRPDADH